MHTFCGYLGIFCSAWLLLPGEIDGNKKNWESRTRQNFTFPAMGVEFQVTYFASPERAGPIQERIRQRVEQIEQVFSDYRSTSEVSRLGQSTPHDKPQAVSPDLWKLSCISREISQRTEGAFDVTVGNLSHVWRMARKRNRLPAPKKISAALEQTGYHDVTLHANRSLRLGKRGMRLDFGGIAKGYAADEVLRLLGQMGICSALVDAGGDIAVSEAPPGQSGWQIRLVEPSGQAGATAAITLQLANAAVATSGDLNQFLLLDGRRYSHIIDPRTGQATTHISQVTVTAPTATLADAYASAISVIGARGGLALINELCQTECLIWERGSEPDLPLERFVSQRWQQTGTGQEKGAASDQ